MKKTRFTVILALFFALVLTASCGVQSKATPAPAPAAASQEMHTLKIAGVSTSSWYSTHLTEDYKEYPIWDAVNQALLDRGLQIEIEIIQFDQMQMISQTRLATGVELPDVMYLSYLDLTTQFGFANQGVFVPIQDVLKYSDGTASAFYAGPGKFGIDLNKFPDGKNYWITGYLSTMWNGELFGNPFTVMMRKDWLEQYGLPVPKTSEDFYDALKTFQDNDASGNGIKDEIIAVEPYFGTSISGWFDVGSEIMYVDRASSKVLSPWFQPGIKDYINYMKRLSDDGLYDVTAYERTTELAADNRLSAQIGYSTLGPVIAAGINTGDAPDAEVMAVGPLTTPNSALKSRGTADSAVVATNAHFAILSACKDLKAAAIWLDFLTSDEYYVLGEWGIEGEFHEFVDGQYKLLHTDRPWMADNRISNMFWLFGAGVFPRMNLGENLNITAAHLPDYAKDYLTNFPDKNPLIARANEQTFMAVPTDEEQTRAIEIFTDLSTYSKETFLKLVLGQLGMDDWDKYISELKALGLDDYLSIGESRYNRFLN